MFHNRRPYESHLAAQIRYDGRGAEGYLCSCACDDIYQRDLVFPVPAYLDMSSGDLPERERRARPVWLCRAENLNFLSVSTSKNRFTKPLHMLQTPSYSRTGRVSFSNTLLAMPGSFAASSTSSRAGDCCAMRG